ncbi:MAG: hypothetical protein ACRDR6_04495 [Pseudonocardiaceae bacterium]
MMLALPENLAGRVALVTGAASGIGAAVGATVTAFGALHLAVNNAGVTS